MSIRVRRAWYRLNLSKPDRNSSRHVPITFVSRPDFDEHGTVAKLRLVAYRSLSKPDQQWSILIWSHLWSYLGKYQSDLHELRIVFGFVQYVKSSLHSMDLNEYVFYFQLWRRTGLVQTDRIVSRGIKYSFRINASLASCPRTRFVQIDRIVLEEWNEVCARSP